jgi:pimeloyl-ACP methyl ester carboxylesterase
MSKKENRIQKKRRGSPLTGIVGGLLGAAVGAAGGWIAYSKMFIDHSLPLPDAIPAERVSFNSEKAGQLNYYVDRHASGHPLVLIHSVNAAASSFEMRPLFEHYRSQRPVYALDLPGYGFSERTPREYRPQTFSAAILDLLETQVGEPADVIALSLGCEFAARAAQEKPQHFHSLTLISPSGFNALNTGRASQKAEASGSSDVFYSIFSNPFWGQPLFDLIATRRSIEFFLQQSFVGPIANGMVDYAYVTSHQPGAEHVPLYFLSGKLFSPNILIDVYKRLELPVLVIYDRDAFVHFDRLPEVLATRSNWRAKRISPSLGLPQFEKLPETAQALDDFWSGLE